MSKFNCNLQKFFYALKNIILVVKDTLRMTIIKSS